MKLPRSTVAAAIAFGLLVGSAVGVKAQDDEVSTASFVSPGPLGKSTSDWHTEYLDWWLRSHGDWIERLDANVGIDCSGGDHGDVFFLPAVPPFLEGVSMDCQIGSNQHILMVPEFVLCNSDGSEITEWQEANKKQRPKLQARIATTRASAWACMAQARPGSSTLPGPPTFKDEVPEPVLIVDGVPTDIDARYIDASAPVYIEEAQFGPLFETPLRFASVGYVVMMEPLALGTHTIEASNVTPLHITQGDFVRYNIEVVEGGLPID